ncbi:MAG: SDR family oxidoreductase [Myxococcota bacterium]
MGLTALVTGSNTGIGKAVAAALAERGYRVFVACRSEAKGRMAVSELRERTRVEAVEFHALDLASFAAVQSSAEDFLSKDIALDVLVNNAGVAGQRGLTKDGFELAFGINHLGHFLLTSKLMPALQRAAHARIVNVTSQNHYHPKRVDWEALRRPTESVSGLKEYGVSKLANVLFTAELARRHEIEELTAYASHPGRVASDIWRRIPWPIRPLFKRTMLTVEQGAHSTVHCATAPELQRETGRYYHSDGKPKEPNPLAKDANLAKELWRRSVEWCGLEESSPS